MKLIVAIIYVGPQLLSYDGKTDSKTHLIFSPFTKSASADKLIITKKPKKKQEAVSNVEITLIK